MFYCDVSIGGKVYNVSVTDSGTIIGVVQKDTSRLQPDYCTVYESDGKTICEDLYIRKRIGNCAKEHITKRVSAINNMIKATLGENSLTPNDA